MAAEFCTLSTHTVPGAEEVTARGVALEMGTGEARLRSRGRARTRPRARTQSGPSATAWAPLPGHPGPTPVRLAPFPAQADGVLGAWGPGP